MDVLYCIILGIVQGLSEFLPISSSGHLLLLEKLGVGTPDLFFNVMLHVGTLFAVVVAMRKPVAALVKKPFSKQTGLLLVACVPTVIIALVFKLCFPSLLNGKMLGFGFVLTATLLFVGENVKIAQNGVLSYKTSILTGVLQGIAVLPGVSRSGATISTLTFLGIEKRSAADFSFLLSIPIILGSAIVEIVDIWRGGFALSLPWYDIVIGVVFAFVSGLVAIKFFLKLVANYNLKPFIIYTALLGVVVSILPLFGVKI